MSGDLRTCDTRVWDVIGSGPGYQSGYTSGDLRIYDTPVWEVICSLLVVRVNIGLLSFKTLTPDM